jgi:hypothetical protein
MLAGTDQLREVKRLHDGAGVTATSTSVFPGHDEVRRIAESGTAPAPVPVRHPSSPRRPSDSAGRPTGRTGGYQGRNGSSDRPSSNSERRGGPSGAGVDGSRRHQPRRRTPGE